MLRIDPAWAEAEKSMNTGELLKHFASGLIISSKSVCKSVNNYCIILNRRLQRILELMQIRGKPPKLAKKLKNKNWGKKIFFFFFVIGVSGGEVSVSWIKCFCGETAYHLIDQQPICYSSVCLLLDFCFGIIHVWSLHCKKKKNQ